MNTNYFDNIDWRKQAAMTATNDLDVEKAFSDQASGFVENKVGDLMKDAYRVGFEIVKKNDENTRIVGIFAFKVDKSLIFAPVFFINGEIKGPLLYRCEQKKFVPATKEWGNYLVESMEIKEGRGRSMNRRGDSPPHVRMHRLTFAPTGMGKSASVGEDHLFEGKSLTYSLQNTDEPGKYRVLRKDSPFASVNKDYTTKTMRVSEDYNSGTVKIEVCGEGSVLTDVQAKKIKEASARDVIELGDNKFLLNEPCLDAIRDLIFTKESAVDGWADAMMDAIEKEASDNGELLKEFLCEKDFGAPAADAIIKAAELNREFAERLVAGYGSADNLFPEKYNYTEKEATAKPTLSIVYDVDLLEKSAEVSKEYFAQGFYIKDTRPQDMVSRIEKYEDVLTAATSPGVYSILKTDGTFLDNVLVVRGDTGQRGPSSSYCPSRLATDKADRHAEAVTREYLSGYGSVTTAQAKNAILIHDGDILNTGSAFGIETDNVASYTKLTSDISEGSLYAVIETKSGKMLDTYYISGIKTVDGVKFVTAHKTDALVDWQAFTYKQVDLIVNKDLSVSDPSRNVFGSDVKWVKINADITKCCSDSGYSIKTHKIESVALANSVDAFVTNSFNLPKVTIEKSDVLSKKAYTLSAYGEKSAPMTRLNMLVKLAQDMSIHASDAYRIVNEADSNGATSFVWQPMEKSALRLRLVDQPDFEDGFDSEFGVPVTPTQEFKLTVHGDQTFERPSAIGDAMNPTTPTGLPDMTVACAEPEELQGLADLYKLPHIFDHAVVGTLADTFNAMPLVQKYISKLEEGVDALGRIKFLLHWCPSDFERSYGDDEMVNFESEVDSNFIAQGSLLLKLIKKNDALRKEDDVEHMNTEKENS